MDWFGSRIQRLINKEDLDRDTIKKMFTQVLEGEQPDLQQGAFLAALAAKGEIPEEIAGAWEAIREIDTIKVEPKVDGPILDNCGTGMDPLKTFNISTTASILAAAGGVVLARHGARSITSKCGTVDVAEALGVDVEAGVEVAKKSVEQCGLGLFNGMSPLVHPKGLFRILSQIRFGTTLNIAGSLASPIMPHLGVRGVFSPEMVDRVAEVMRENGAADRCVKLLELVVPARPFRGPGPLVMPQLEPVFGHRHIKRCDNILPCGHGPVRLGFFQTGRRALGHLDIDRHQHNADIVRVDFDRARAAVRCGRRLRYRRRAARQCENGGQDCHCMRRRRVLRRARWSSDQHLPSLAACGSPPLGRTLPL